MKIKFKNRTGIWAQEIENSKWFGVAVQLRLVLPYGDWRLKIQSGAGEQ